MTQQTVGKVYAEALFQLSQEEGMEKQIYTELNQITDLMEQQPEFLLLMNVPTLSAGERTNILRRVIGNQPGITENFLCLLVEKRRFNRLPEIRRAFNQLYYDASGAAEVFVTTVVALNARQRIALQDKMRKRLGKSILLRETVDPSLIGGMIVQHGDTRMDNSIRTKLQQFNHTDS